MHNIATQADPDPMVPRAVLTWQREWSTVKGQDDVGRILSVIHSGFGTTPTIVEGEAGTVIVIGAPIRADRLDAKGVAAAVAENGMTPTFLRELNGQFLIALADRAGRRLAVANDRFASIPLYYAWHGDCFTGSFLYIDLFRRLQNTPGFALRPEVMLEYIWLQKVQLDKTYDTLSRYLLPASRLQIEDGALTIDRYWRPDFTKRENRSVRGAANEFVSLVKQSLARQTSDRNSPRYGLFLSGGHDSRTIAAAFPKPFTSFTVAFSENYEVECARRIASAAGSAHRFILLPPDQFTRHFNTMSELCGGMFATDHALFVGIREPARVEADVFFHGHGLDYLFQGMYVPAQNIHVFGRPTFFRRLLPLSGDVAGSFLQSISFRLKNLDLLQIIVPTERNRLSSFVHESTAAVLAEGNDVCGTDYDRWEYLLVHALSRHYSWPNIASKMTCGELRTPCFDNDLFDFYCSLPAEQRVEGAVLRHALNDLSSEIGRIPSANWGLPAAASPAAKTALLIARKLLRHATGNARFQAPSLAQRTWPDRSTYLLAHPEYQRLMREAIHSEVLADAIPVLDWKLVRQLFEACVTGDGGTAGLFVSLLSLYGLLRHKQ